MSRTLQLDKTPDRLNLEPGHYLLSIQNIKEIQDAKNPGLLIYLGTFLVEEPDAFEGQVHMERYTIGVEGDPDAMQESTWKRSMGARNLKQLLKAAQVPDFPDDDALFAAAKDSRFVARIAKDKTGEYSNIRGYFTVTSPEAAQVGLIASPTAQATVNGAGGGATTVPTKMKCNECGEAVDRAEYGKHLMSHRPKPESTPETQAQAVTQ